MARLLRSRIAFHHSGLSYGARAGVLEPLAKAGQLRVVVATMGLAAGINFSLRSVALAGDSYRRDYSEHALRSDEILQMFGRAGRRGIDETGYVLVSANQIRILDAHAASVKRSGLVDWSALLGILAAAADGDENPFAAAVRVQDRLFTSKPIVLGVEEAMKHPNPPCGLETDAERARRVRRKIRQLLNRRGRWESEPRFEDRRLGDIHFLEIDEPIDTSANRIHVRTRSILGDLSRVETLVQGTVSEAVIDGQPEVIRRVAVAERLEGERFLLGKWVRKAITWKGRQVSRVRWTEKVEPLIAAAFHAKGTPVVHWEIGQRKVVALVSLKNRTARVSVDEHGIPLFRPPERTVIAPECVSCVWNETCRRLPTSPGTAFLWRRLGLVEADGTPTLRGRLASFFSHGDGLAIAAALEDKRYPLDELVYELANLAAGHRFSGDDNRWGGRLATVCYETYGMQSVPGYLENGVPPKYGAGAGQVVASVHRNPASKATWITALLGAGDIDRIIIEWRSLLRRVSHSPELGWDRWNLLRKLAGDILNETESPTLLDLPPLDYQQQKRVDHRLPLKNRHRHG